MLFLVRMQFHNHADTQPVKCFECIYDIKFGMLQVRKNEISLRKCSGGTADLHSCAPLRELWLPGSLRDLITTIVNLNPKLYTT